MATSPIHVFNKGRRKPRVLLRSNDDQNPSDACEKETKTQRRRPEGD
jgi:hypothetical protein